MSALDQDSRGLSPFAAGIVDSITRRNNVIVAALDTEFRYIFLNEAYRTEIRILTGKDVALGMSILDLFADMPEQIKTSLDGWQEAMRGKTNTETLEFDDPTRHRRWYRVDRSPVRDAQGEVIGAVEVAYDISERKDTEEEMRRLHDLVARERDRLAALLKGITDEIWYADTDGRFVLVNPSGAQEFGMRPGEEVDVRDLAARLEVRRPDGTPRPVEEAPPLRALKGESVRNQEEVIRTPATGELRYRQVSASPVRNADGDIIGSVSVARDVTDLKLAEEKIRNLATFPEYNTNPVMEIDLAGKVTYANPATIGLLKDAGLSENDTGVFVPADITLILNRLTAREEAVHLCEIGIGGKVFTEAITVVPHLRVGRIYASEITLRRRAEHDLVASRNLLQSIIDSSPRFIHVTDLDGRYLIVNRAVAEMLGMEPDRIKGKTRHEVMPEAVADRYQAHDREVIKAGKALEFEETGMLNDHPISLLTTKFPLFDVAGNIYAIAGMSADISDFKESEEALKREKKLVEKLVEDRTRELMSAEAQLEHARRLADIGALAATVAHELRNPLAAIGMAAYNIRRKAADGTLDKHIASIERKIAESDQIINNLLFYSRIRPPKHEPVDISAFIQEVVEAARHGKSPGPSFHTQIAISRDTRIDADPLQIREVLTNIVNNARDAVPPSGGRIDILCGERDKFVEITIKDNGVGIDKTVIPSVFSPFFSTKAKGTGLGLSICRQIIDFHGGAISIKSEPGEGTEVVVCLPKATGGEH
jgi:PAS domain S-box-containing protein